MSASSAPKKKMRFNAKKEKEEQKRLQTSSESECTIVAVVPGRKRTSSSAVKPCVPNLTHPVVIKPAAVINTAGTGPKSPANIQGKLADNPLPKSPAAAVLKRAEGSKTKHNKTPGGTEAAGTEPVVGEKTNINTDGLFEIVPTSGSSEQSDRSIARKIQSTGTVPIVQKPSLVVKQNERGRPIVRKDGETDQIVRQVSGNSLADICNKFPNEICKTCNGRGYVKSAGDLMVKRPIVKPSPVPTGDSIVGRTAADAKHKPKSLDRSGVKHQSSVIKPTAKQFGTTVKSSAAFTTPPAASGGGLIAAKRMIHQGEKSHSATAGGGGKWNISVSCRLMYSPPPAAAVLYEAPEQFLQSASSSKSPINQSDV